MKLKVNHYKVLTLSGILEPNAVYYLLDPSTSKVKTFITTKDGVPIPLIDLTGIGQVASVTGTGVTGTSANPTINISNFVSSQLNNQIYLSLSDGKLQVNPITSPNASIEVNSTATELQIQLSTSITAQINSALQSGDNISELVNDAGYITIGDVVGTDLTYTATPIDGTVVSSTGNDATVPLATTVNAGLLEPSDKVKLNNTSGVNSGDQNSIVGISGTKAEFNTSLTDGDFLFDGDIVPFDPLDYDLDDFTNVSADPFARTSELINATSIKREEFIYFGGSQVFTLLSDYYQVFSVEVQAQGALSESQYNLIIPNQVEILDTLNIGDYIVILYGEDLLTTSIPYYTQANVDNLLDLKADLVSPTFTGVPNVPTATVGTNNTQIASTAFVTSNTVALTGNQTINGIKTFINKISASADGADANGEAISVIQTNANLGGFYIKNSTNTTFLGGNTMAVNDYRLANYVSNGKLNLFTNGFDRLTIFPNGNIGVGYPTESNNSKLQINGTLNLASYTVATLPTPTGTAYATVTDALAPTYLGALTGGGTVKAPVFYDGTVWRSTINSDSVSLTGNQTLTGIKTFTDSVNIIDDFEPTINFTNNSFSGYLRLNSDSFELSKKVYSPSFIKTGGTASQFLKADGSVDESDVVKNIAKEAAQGANVTGTVSETILYSKLIPANTFKDGDFMNLFSRVVKSGTTGTLGQRVKINTSNTLTGSTLIGRNELTTSNLSGNLIRVFNITNGLIYGYPFTVPSTSDISNFNLAHSSATFDPTVDNYIFITGQLSNSADTMYHLGTKITN